MATKKKTDKPAADKPARPTARPTSSTPEVPKAPPVRTGSGSENIDAAGNAAKNDQGILEKQMNADTGEAPIPAQSIVTQTAGPRAAAKRVITNARVAKTYDPKAVAEPRADRIKVRALETGYYNHARRRAGDVFGIASMDDFSERWMEMADGSEPEHTTGAQAALSKATDEIKGNRAGTNVLE